MDLLDAYSNSSPEATPPNSAPSSPPPVTTAAAQTTTGAKTTTVAVPQDGSTKTPIKLVTGTVESIQFNEASFTQLERALDTTGASIDPQTGTKIHPQVPKPVPRTETRRLPSAGVNVYASRNPLSRKRPRSSSAAPLVPTSKLHISNTHDYQNRSWLNPPSASRTFAELETYTPYIPKQCIYEKTAHSKGVSVARFFPLHGHLLLTTGLDGEAHVWKVADTLSCIRTYSGHSKGIRDATFSEDGTTFLTAAYDRCIRLWDTETGRILGSYTTSGIPYCTRFSPLHDGQEFLAGCGDKKIVQIDVRDASKIVQQYDQHMGAVNSITFIDDDRRFVSSADDKVLRLWEYGVPIVIRDVSHPSAHSMPVTLLHPNRKWLACQSMDNTVRIFSARGKFKPNAKRVFNGHLVSGYACGLATSSDGKFLASADSQGRLFFWDWKTSRVLKALHAHDGVCISVDWHPTRPSILASCGWDGKVKLWD